MRERLLFAAVVLAAASCASPPRVGPDAFVARVPAPAALAGGRPDTLVFCVMGDNRLEGEPDFPSDSPRRRIRRTLNRAAADRRPAFVLHVGDIVWRGDVPRLWDFFLEDTAALLGPRFFYPVPGNHDYKGGFPDRYGDVFSGSVGRARSWSFRAEDLAVIAVDSNVDPSFSDAGDPDSSHARWLRERLDDAGDARFLVVVLHHPVFSSGRGALRRFLAPREAEGHAPRPREVRLRALLADSHGRRVAADPRSRTLVVAGHSHFYERYAWEGIDFIVTGGAGSPLHRPSADNPAFRQAAYDGHHFVEITLTRDAMSWNVIPIGPGAWVQPEP